MAVTPRVLLHVGRALSSWIMFALVCAGAAYLGSHLQASWQRFDATSGERFTYPYNHYLQLLLTADGAAHAVAPSELGQFTRRYPAHALIVDGAPRTVDLATSRKAAALDFRVLGEQAGQPVLETRYEDAEWSIVSRYRVDGTAVTPLYVRAWNVWMVATGLLYYGLPAALLVWLGGRLLRRHEERVLLDRGERPYSQHRYRLS